MKNESPIRTRKQKKDQKNRTNDKKTGTISISAWLGLALARTRTTLLRREQQRSEWSGARNGHTKLPVRGKKQIGARKGLCPINAVWLSARPEQRGVQEDQSNRLQMWIGHIRAATGAERQTFQTRAATWKKCRIITIKPDFCGKELDLSQSGFSSGIPPFFGPNVMKPAVRVANTRWNCGCSGRGSAVTLFGWCWVWFL